MKDKKDEGFFSLLSNIIDDAFAQVFTEKKQVSNPSTPLYSNISEYTEQTGKRFRMSKDQKDRGLTRQQAFTETHLNEEK